MKTSLKLKHSCKLKLDACIFILYKFYVAAGFYRKRTFFFFLQSQPQRPPCNCFATTPEGSSLQKLPPLKWIYVHPLAVYTVEAICQLWSRSRRSVRFARGSFIHDA